MNGDTSNVVLGATIGWQATMREGSTKFDSQQELDLPSPSAQSALDLAAAEATLTILAEVFSQHGPPALNSLASSARARHSGSTSQ